jgi:diguanylate cyclase (GGDEF)-like protein
MHSRKEDDSAQIAHAEGQLEAHKRRLDVLTAEVARNDDKMQRSQQRELRLLLAERMRASVSESPFRHPGDKTVAVTVSIGVVGVRPKPKIDDLKTLGDSMLAHADVALYQAKSAGRDQTAVDAS